MSLHSRSASAWRSGRPASAVATFVVLLGVLFGTFHATSLGGVVLTEREAPEWKISQWLNGDPGDLADHTGRVVLVHFFQLWCPGCNNFTVPLFQRWQEEFGTRDDVLIVGIHTVFEGHDVQTPQALERYLADRGIEYPVGIDDYDAEDPAIPVTMRRYETEGTPQVAIIDKHGKLRFFHFGRFDPFVVEGMVERLLKEIGPPPGTRKPSAGPKLDKKRTGKYRVTLAQTSKTCGRLIRPLTVEADLTVGVAEIRSRLGQTFMGINDLNARYVPATGKFATESTRRISVGGGFVNLTLKLDGAFKPNSNPPEFEYQYTFERSGDTPGPEDCRIEGRGKGVKSVAGGQR